MKKLSFLLFLIFGLSLHAQPKYHNYVKDLADKGRWKQHVDYKMEIDVDVNTFKYTGKQTLLYTNNSPDTINRVFYHLYLNAFQPDSEMDVRSRSIVDPDRRVRDRISKLNEDEIGYSQPTLLRQDGQALDYKVQGTILDVYLANPILPGETTEFYMEWESQLPVQIRRSGRNNAEGVALSMTQWFPKIVMYDEEGWHADPYVGREFYSNWGDYDVKITIDNRYTIGGTGYLQNPDEIGHGYTDKKVKHKKRGKLTWHFIAPDVHDFAWAADPEFIHDIYPGPNGVDLHFIYKDNPEIKENWKNLQPKTAWLMEFMNERVGQYPYHQYTVVQGGDGGMEYAMSTLITGEREFESLVGVTAHELAHSWFQFVLASNETRYSWLDEGFTNWLAAEGMNIVMEENSGFPQASHYNGYAENALSGKEEPLSTQADRHTTNYSFSINSYYKGAVFLNQLRYIVGENTFDMILWEYFNQFKFQHPNPMDFIRVAEKVAEMELKWYLEDFTQTTKTIDYGIKEVVETDKTYEVTLERIGMIPMPIDLYISYDDEDVDLVYIPLDMMRNNKKPEFNLNMTSKKAWTWGHPTYTVSIPKKGDRKAKFFIIDATQRLADINPENNVYEME